MKLGSTTNTPNHIKLSWKRVDKIKPLICNHWESSLQVAGGHHSYRALRDLCQRRPPNRARCPAKKGIHVRWGLAKGTPDFSRATWPSPSTTDFTHVPCLQLSGNHPQSTDSGTSRSPMVPWLAHLREETAERQCPHQLPTARWWAVGGTFSVSRSYLLVRSLLPRRCPRVVLSATHKEKDWETHEQAPRPGIPAFSVISPFQSFPLLCLMRPELDNSQGPLSSAGSM